MKKMLFLRIFVFTIVCIALYAYRFIEIKQLSNMGYGNSVCFKDAEGNKISNFSMGDVDFSVGDSYEYDFVIENEGMRDATITSIETNLGDDGQKPLNWTIRRKDDGAKLRVGDNLNSGEKVPCTFFLEYNKAYKGDSEVEWYWSINVE